MRVRMPVVFGSNAFAPVFNAVELAISKEDFPIELDCVDVQMVTSSFYTLVVGALKRAGTNRDQVCLINVSPKTLQFMQTCKFDRVVSIRMIND